MRLRCLSVTKNIMKIRYHLPSSSRSGDVIHPSECVWRFNKIAAKTRNFSISYRSFSWYSWKIGYQTNGQSLIASDNVRTFRILCTRQTTFLIPLFFLYLWYQRNNMTSIEGDITSLLYQGNVNELDREQICWSESWKSWQSISSSLISIPTYGL